ncbi:MAG: hypothetical protein EBT03_09130 [Betaproteobacteria bacterium]|nr:hypothetical protein [Betaproteobacteria bacterium]NCA17538.1 hypothetical protein [Betaproteobacteria bacterium]
MSFVAVGEYTSVGRYAACGEYTSMGAVSKEWPPFARGFARWCKENRQVVEPTAKFFQQAGLSLAQSTGGILGGPGIAMSTMGSLMLTFLEDGQPADVVKRQSKVIADYASFNKLAMGIATIVLPFTGVGLPAAPITAAATAALGATESIFRSLSKGKAPRTEDLVTLLDVAGVKISDKLDTFKDGLREVDKALGLGKDIPGLGGKLTELQEKAGRLPKAPAKKESAEKTALDAAVREKEAARARARTAAAGKAGKAGAAGGPTTPAAIASSSSVLPIAAGVGALALVGVLLARRK